ncbi:hypothetical protein CEXT_179391 [Caerostris extrusa]|uniref:Uncharacterized protein n=1 Tax=Caerostris extrusa TaxID=172846 RepID=A0AAV4VJI8_CAEEX|nr:hypothetical protein CEXT_179391 [Caerostris extrusa]
MEVSADDPFSKTTSKGSFAPTEIKANGDTLKIRVGWQGEETEDDPFSKTTSKGSFAPTEIKRQRRHSQNKVAKRILLRESWYAFVSADLS